MDYGWGRPTYGDDGEEKPRQRTISSGTGGGGISTFVNEWNPPYQGPSQSVLGEQEQFQALGEYKKKLVAELEEFRPMDRYLVRPHSFSSSSPVSQLELICAVFDSFHFL